MFKLRSQGPQTQWSVYRLLPAQDSMLLYLPSQLSQSGQVASSSKSVGKRSSASAALGGNQAPLKVDQWSRLLGNPLATHDMFGQSCMFWFHWNFFTHDHICCDAGNARNQWSDQSEDDFRRALHIIYTHWLIDLHEDWHVTDMFDAWRNIMRPTFPASSDRTNIKWCTLRLL